MFRLSATDLWSADFAIIGFDRSSENKSKTPIDKTDPIRPLLLRQIAVAAARVEVGERGSGRQWCVRDKQEPNERYL